MERVVRMLLLSCFLSPDFVADDHSFFKKKKKQWGDWSFFEGNCVPR
jgi:hypothetical protein